MPARIAFVSTIFSHGWGGADTLWTAVASAALQRGDKILLSVSPTVAAHHKVQELVRLGAQLDRRTPSPDHYPLSLRIRLRLGLAAPHDTALIASLERFRPDLIIFNLGGTYDMLPFRKLGQWLHDRRVCYQLVANWQTEHPFLCTSDLDFLRVVFQDAVAVNFVSRRILDNTRRHLLLPFSNARVVQNPLRWQPSDRCPWSTSSTLRLATVSRLDHIKGIHLLLHALHITSAELPDWRLEIIGSGPQEDYLRETVAHFGLAHRVAFRGHVSSLREIWSMNHLFVSPAIDEGVPMTIPEAMLCARPVLATCVGGAEDWIQHGETGFLCPAPTVPLLADALREAARARDRWQTMGTAAATAAEARYRPDDHLALID